MKRSTAIKLLAPILSQKDIPVEITAELIINQLEELALLTPTHKVKVTRRDMELMPYEDEIEIDGWRKE
jgi:hypothetical protein